MPPLIGIGAGIPFGGAGGETGLFVPPYTLLDNSTPDYFQGDLGYSAGPDPDNLFTVAFVVGKFSSLSANQTILDISTGRLRLRVKLFGATYHLNLFCRDTVNNVMVNTYNDSAFAIDTLYGCLCAIDFSGASTDVTIKVNNLSAITDDAARSGGDGNGVSFGNTFLTVLGNNSAVAQPFDGCLGPLWLIKGVYETDWTKFFEVDNTPKNWTTNTDVTSLGTPHLYIKDYLADQGSDIVANSGSGADIDILLGSTIVGSPVACSI